MPTKRKFKSAAVQELYDELIDDDTAAQEEFEGGLVNIEAAQLIYAMRTKAGLSQRELARNVGTSAGAGQVMGPGLPCPIAVATPGRSSSAPRATIGVE